jgi:trimethylamine--corrinoid protein Co-methyltransferase
LFENIHFKADFLKQRETRKLFAKEQYLPSPVIDRGSLRTWQQAGRLDAFARAKARATELIATYQKPVIDPAVEQELQARLAHLARAAGMPEIPSLTEN